MSVALTKKRWVDVVQWKGNSREEVQAFIKEFGIPVSSIVANGSTLVLSGWY